MALFPTQHTLTQGSLHYRLATLGYQKRNTYGVETCIFRYDLFRFMWYNSANYAPIYHSSFYTLLSTTLTSLINPFVVTNILICNAVSVVPLIAQG